MTFYAELTQESCHLLNGKSVHYMITTYCGHNNILGMSINNFCKDILNQVNQDSPFLLKPLVFNPKLLRHIMSRYVMIMMWKSSPMQKSPSSNLFIKSFVLHSGWILTPWLAGWNKYTRMRIVHLSPCQYINVTCASLTLSSHCIQNYFWLWLCLNALQSFSSRHPEGHQKIICWMGQSYVQHQFIPAQMQPSSPLQSNLCWVKTVQPH